MKRGMEPPALASLLPLVSRRFQSFAEAADASLAMLGASLPGSILIGQIEREERLLRVLDARGDDALQIERGSTVQLRSAASSSESSRQLTPYKGDDLDPGFLRSRAVVERATVPIELSDGAIAGLICALSQQQSAYQRDHLILLGLASRLLSYEWERVSAGAELRQLRQQLNDGERGDSETGLCDRDGLIEKMTREWRLASRGTVESMIVVCRITAVAHDAERASALNMLALKDAAEALRGCARWTDHVARVGPCDLAVVMVGADTSDAVEAMINRYAESMRRVTGGRPYEISISYGAKTLSEAATSEQALEQAEQAIDDAGAVDVQAFAGSVEVEQA